MLSFKDSIKQKALELGFDACGIASIAPFTQEREYLEQWLHMGYQGSMHYLENYIEQRENMQLLGFPIQSAIVVLLNYYPQQLQHKQQAQIAKYAYGKDYHFIIKQKLNQLSDFIQAHEPSSSNQAFTDSAPIFERQLAQRAGLGWIGKNGLLIHPKIGSYTFIGELLTSLKLPADSPQESRCGTCKACINACPTGAIIKDKIINASRCISYLTIEHKGPIPEVIKPHMGQRLYGCDTCLDVCPWNRKAQTTQCKDLEAIPEIYTLNSENFSRSVFKNAFKFSAMQRAGYQKIRDRLKELESQH